MGAIRYGKRASGIVETIGKFQAGDALSPRTTPSDPPQVDDLLLALSSLPLRKFDEACTRGARDLRRELLRRLSSERSRPYGRWAFLHVLVSRRLAAMTLGASSVAALSADADASTPSMQLRKVSSQPLRWDHSPIRIRHVYQREALACTSMLMPPDTRPGHSEEGCACCWEQPRSERTIDNRC